MGEKAIAIGKNVRRQVRYLFERSVYEAMKDKCPEWWAGQGIDKAGLRVAIDGICNLKARGLSDEQVAKQERCPVEYVQMITNTRASEIKSLTAQYQEYCDRIRELRECGMIGPALMPDDAIIAICYEILKGYYKREGQEWS